MENVFGKYLTSPLFTFQVGPDKKEVTVHSAPLAGLSPSLNTLINGEMIEAKTRRVVWPDVDADTFTRLCEFAYLQDYTPPSYRFTFEDWISDPISPEPPAPISPDLPAPDVPAASDASPPNVIDLRALSPKERNEKTRFASKNQNRSILDCLLEPQFEPIEPPVSPSLDDEVLPYKERSVWTQHLRDKFTDRSFLPEPQPCVLDFTPSSNTGPRQDFTPVFVGQVQLYILADKYGIQPLCELVLDKLYQTLKSFTLYSTGVPGVIEFVRFVYANAPPDFGDRKDPLRELTIRYIVSVLGQIGETKEFRELLEEGGVFVTDLWHIVWSS